MSQDNSFPASPRQTAPAPTPSSSGAGATDNTPDSLCVRCGNRQAVIRRRCESCFEISSQIASAASEAFGQEVKW